MADKPKAQSQPPNADPLKHPLLRQVTQADQLLAAQQKRQERKQFQIKELEQWKAALDGMARTPDGQLFLRSMIQFSGLFDPPSMRDTIKMVEDKMSAAFYLEWVRPFLKPALRMEIEK